MPTPSHSQGLSSSSSSSSPAAALLHSMAGPSTPSRRGARIMPTGGGMSSGSNSSDITLKRSFPSTPSPSKQIRRPRTIAGEDEEDLPLGAPASKGKGKSKEQQGPTRFFTSRLSDSETSEDEEMAMLPSTPTRQRVLSGKSASSSSLTPLSSVRKGKKKMKVSHPDEAQAQDGSEQARSGPSSSSELRLTPTSTPPRSSSKRKAAYHVKGNVTPSRAFALFKPRAARVAGALPSSASVKERQSKSRSKKPTKSKTQSTASLRSEDSALAGLSSAQRHDADGDTLMAGAHDDVMSTPLRRKQQVVAIKGMQRRRAVLHDSSCEEEIDEEEDEMQVRQWQQETPIAAAGHFLSPTVSPSPSRIRPRPSTSTSTSSARLLTATSSLGSVPLVARHLVTHSNAANTLYRMRTAGIGGVGGAAFGRMGLFDGGRLGKIDLQGYFSRFRSDPVSSVYHIPHRPLSTAYDAPQAVPDHQNHASPRAHSSISSDAENIPPVPTRQPLSTNDAPALPPSAPTLGHPLCCAYSYSSSHAESAHQWLAIGSGDGRVSLIDTSCDMETSEPYDWDFWQMSSNDGISGRPSWQASDASIFILSWRHDDRVLATGSSDYEVRLWDTQSSECLGRYSTYAGSSRQIAWDPHGNGNLLCNGGRDGAIHLYDVRTSTPASASGLHCEFETGDAYEMYNTHHFDSAARKPVMSLWNVHTDTARTFSMLDASYPKNLARKVPPKGVTAVAYVPGREHCIVSGACADATVKMWDFRGVSAPIAAEVQLGVDDNSKPKMTQASRGPKSKTWKPTEQTDDLSTRDGLNKRSHGISSMVTSKDKIFAACTDGRIYTVPTSSLYESLTVTQGSGTPLYSSIQRQNTLYAKMALSQDERMLAIGCNSGDVMLWDVGRDGLATKEGVRLHDRCNAEINGVSWASGLRGTTVASIADDLSIRCWRADR